MALGSTLREAREALGMSTTEVAEHTNMMVQIVEELENEDFHRIAAPIYGRGFLKLYAELVKIDVHPLIEEFMDIYTGKTAPTVHRKETTAEIKKPLPMAGALEEDEPQQEPVVPQRAPIVPHQAVRTIEGAPRPLARDDIAPVVQPAPPSEVKSSLAPAPVEKPVSSPGVFQSAAPQPVIKPLVESVPEEEQIPVDEPVPNAEIPPEPGDDLFAVDEPNLFNTTPIQERIAEARRVMDEKNVEQEESTRKSPSLNLNRNQRVPLFQINGRMDETYESSPREPRRFSRTGRSIRTVTRSFGDLFKGVGSRMRLRITEGNRKYFVYGTLGIIVIALMASGTALLFKLTQPAAEEGDRSPVKPAVVEKNAPVRALPPDLADGKIPPPPDMYFD